MTFNRFIAALLALAVGGAACGSLPSKAPIPPSPANSSFNLLVVAQGKVELKRSGWSDFHPTSFGALLHRGDELRLPEDANATVLCDNLSPWVVPSGAPSGLSNGCPQVPEPALVRSAGLIGNTRGSTDPLIPYIISPRATKLLNPAPTLRWNSVPGAKSYTIRISGTEWQETVSTTEFVYPGNPPLQPGSDYLLVVEADNGKSSKDEGQPGLGFGILPDDEAGRVRAGTAAIGELNLPEGAKAFALAQLYSGHALYAEAIEKLAGMPEAESQAANVHLALGALYQQVGLPAMAEVRYTRALQLAQTADDLESVAAAQAGLGTVYTSLGNKDEAVRNLTQAENAYKTLGDSEEASQVAEQLLKLGK